MFNESAILPQEMLVLPHWVCWCYVQRKKKPKPDKPLFDAKTRPFRYASSTNPTTWSTYTQAVSRTRDNPRHIGIGFVFTPPFIGVDMDDCVKDGAPNLLAREVLARFPHTYAELSPSGHGMHLIVQGVFPWEHGQKSSLGEIYSSGRYFTVTGNKLENALAQVQHVSEDDLNWLLAKFKPKKAFAQSRNGAGDQGRHGVPQDTGTDDVYKDRTPLATDSPLYKALCAGNPNWEITWDRSRKLEGVEGDQSPSAYEMSLARMAVQEGVDKQVLYQLLVGWRIDQRLPPKNHGALVSTIENAHKEFAETAQDKLLGDPETLEQPKSTLAAHIEKLLGLSIARFVQMGSDEARYRVVLTNGHARDMGTYDVCKTFAPWERLAAEQMGKRLSIEKKRWVKIFTMLFAMRDVEESEETGAAAETGAWLTEYLSDLTCHPATVDTLRQSAPFVDETGSYLQLDAFHTYAAIHCGARGVTRGAMAGRLKVVGWEPVKLSRAEEKRAITRNYWHRAL